jgi:hypothetical protein
MKHFLSLAVAFVSFSAFAAGPRFNNLTKSQVEDISREFSANFSHTGVSAPETDGLWGVEVGIVAGKSKSPDLADVIDSSTGDGSDFESLYHAGVMARAHFPFDIFAEMSLLPERDINDVKVKSSSFEIGWNAGGFFSLPIDLAVGLNVANSDLSFKQTQPVASEISIESKTKMAWIGVSKTFLFVTPYLKLGKANSESDVKSTQPLVFANGNQTVDNSGGYLALGANLQFAFLKLGFEASQIMSVKRASAKISFDF